MLSRAVDPLVQAVGRVPATVHAKLLVAFVGTVVLLVVLGVLGLRVMGDSNDRVVTLGVLQQRATAYRELQTGAAQVRTFMALRRKGGLDLCALTGDCASAVPTGSLLAVDGTIVATLSGLAKATEPDRLGFVPPGDEQSTLALMRQYYVQLSEVMTRITAFDGPGGDATAGLKLQAGEAEPLENRLQDLTDTLVATTQGATNALIELNRSAFAVSQNLFIAVAVGGIVLALLLGYVLSWSIVRPIRRMETGLAAIASGDFSGRVDVPNRDELGSLAANVNRMNDELGRLYQELETASRHKSEFLANMSHELRTPLNAVIGFSDVLSEQMFGELNPKQLEYLDDIRSSGRHLLALINDILDLSKVEAGRMELVMSHFSLPEVIESGMTMVRERAARQGIELALKLDLKQDVIEADERKIKQVLFNLLSNAVKFTPPGGHVTVTARDDADNVEISVRDSGIGIDKEDQVRIFEAFQQAERGPARVQEGTGLGLGLARRFVELHGGTITVDSEPGQGSTFTVRLPARRSLANVA